MMLSKVFWGSSEDSPRRIGFRISWKTAAFIGLPALFVGCAGFYYFHKRHHSAQSAQSDSIPKTPLETAVALKTRGNKFFKAGQYEKAVQLYTQGLEVCPLDAAMERAALFQNRAAAKENLRQYESAIADCSSALEHSPRYLKALNRRARLYEKLDSLDDCLIDVVACCIFEEFKNADNIICMDQTLKKVGQKKAVHEWEKLAHTLPSASFIRNYLSAFAWNPFKQTTEPKQSNPLLNGTDKLTNSEDVNDQLFDFGSTKPQIPSELFAAYNALDQSLELLVKGDYETCMKQAEKTCHLFESALNRTTIPIKSAEHNVVEAGDSDAHTTDVPVAINGISDDISPPPIPSAPESILSTEHLDRAKAAQSKALLLYATFLALSGRSAEAKQRLQSVFAESSGADPVDRVNALIKSACLSMSVDQDFAACLYDFQTAQNTCPECPDVYLHRGQINLLADQLDEALHDLNTAVKLKPEFSIAQAQRLYALYRKALSDSNPERASSRVEEFRKLSQKYPHCIETHSLFAQVLIERGDFSASDEQFAKVIELSPDSGLAYAHRGLLQLRWKQDRDAALKWFSIGVEADPKSELIHELLGQLAVEQGDFDTALDHFNKAIQEAKTKNDLSHLIALREGVIAQSNVCQKYGIPVLDVVNSLKREQQQMMMGMM